MTFQTELENRIARERRKIAELRNEIMRREAFIQGLSEALKILPIQSSTQEVSSVPLRAGSDVKKAQQLLSATNGPLHISDIIKGIGNEDTRKNRASLVSSLARYARRGEIFQREGPNEFSLIPVPTEETAPLSDSDSETTLPALFGAG